METKDYITNLLSIIAIIISVISLRFSIIARKSESEFRSRELLSDVISRLIELKSKIEGENRSKNETIKNNLEYINAKTRHIVLIGEYYFNKTSNNTNDFDCITLADAFMSFQYYEKAERFYIRATEVAETEVLRVFALRNLAHYWFRRKNETKGRSVFQEAMSKIDKSSDYGRKMAVDTYFVWAQNEKNMKFQKESSRLLESALSLAYSIGDESARLEWVSKIEREKEN